MYTETFNKNITRPHNPSLNHLFANSCNYIQPLPHLSRNNLSSHLNLSVSICKSSSFQHAEAGKITSAYQAVSVIKAFCTTRVFNLTYLLQYDSDLVRHNWVFTHNIHALYFLLTYGINYLYNC